MLFSTCNPHGRLEKVLLGFAAQDRGDCAVVMADDGGDKASGTEPMRAHRRMPASYLLVGVRGLTA